MTHSQRYGMVWAMTLFKKLLILGGIIALSINAFAYDCQLTKAVHIAMKPFIWVTNTNKDLPFLLRTENPIYSYNLIPTYLYIGTSQYRDGYSLFWTTHEIETYSINSVRINDQPSIAISIARAPEEICGILYQFFN